MAGVTAVGGSPKTPNIKDVATLAGVSVSTVSRFLNNSPRLSPQAKAKIEQAVRMLNYRPSGIARGLVSASMKSITIFSSETTLYGSAMAIQGIEDMAAEYGYSAGICTISDSSDEEIQAVMHTALDQNPSGAIVLNYDPVAGKALNLLPQDLPVVVIGGNRVEQRNQVSLCEKEGGEALTQYLLSKGHSTVYHITIPGGSGSYSRTSGWESALRKKVAVIHEPIQCSWLPEDARNIGKIMAMNSDVDAVFAGNDELAMGFIRGLHDAGKRVPEDVEVVGFDDHPLSSIWEPAITTLRQDFEAAGQYAMQMLCLQLEGSEQIRIPHDSPVLDVIEQMKQTPVELPVQGHIVYRESA